MSDTTAQPTTPEPSAKSFRWSSLILWVFVIGLLGFLGWGLIQTSKTRPEAGQTAPDFNVQFLDGYEWEGRQTASLDDFKGKIVVLNFWASWCVECRVEADAFEASWQKYRDDGVVFLGVAHVDVEPKSIAYLKEFNITYPNALDYGDRISSDYEITGVPETFIIDPTGQVHYVQIGPIQATTLNGTIEQLLAQGG
ncbi:MAG: TlpA disulfide reductase family protein [Anaerolineae bacterium]|jgi:cytochrome c biogenesis protein CcmG, thiol:disulfide interchange protein DsbE